MILPVVYLFVLAVIYDGIVAADIARIFSSHGRPTGNSNLT